MIKTRKAQTRHYPLQSLRELPSRRRDVKTGPRDSVLELRPSPPSFPDYSQTDQRAAQSGFGPCQVHGAELLSQTFLGAAFRLFGPLGVDLLSFPLIP